MTTSPLKSAAQMRTNLGHVYPEESLHYGDPLYFQVADYVFKPGTRILTHSGDFTHDGRTSIRGVRYSQAVHLCDKAIAWALSHTDFWNMYCRFADQAVEQGYSRLGSRFFLELLRWFVSTRAVPVIANLAPAFHGIDEDVLADFKIQNTHSPYLARLWFWTRLESLADDQLEFFTLKALSHNPPKVEVTPDMLGPEDFHVLEEPDDA
jgi:hypothetical protein